LLCLQTESARGLCEARFERWRKWKTTDGYRTETICLRDELVILPVNDQRHLLHTVEDEGDCDGGEAAGRKKTRTSDRYGVFHEYTLRSDYKFCIKVITTPDEYRCRTRLAAGTGISVAEADAAGRRGPAAGRNRSCRRREWIGMRSSEPTSCFDRRHCVPGRWPLDKGKTVLLYVTRGRSNEFHRHRRMPAA
jgi:hypothetical protein